MSVVPFDGSRLVRRTQSIPSEARWLSAVDVEAQGKSRDHSAGGHYSRAVI